MIGGHVEPGETSGAALERELYEEVGVRPLAPLPIGVIDFSEEAGRAVFYALFKVDRFVGEPRLANEEHTELRWFTLGEAAALGPLASDKYRPYLRAQRRPQTLENQRRLVKEPNERSANPESSEIVCSGAAGLDEAIFPGRTLHTEMY